MDLTGLSSIADLGKAILERVVPDPAQKAQAQLAIEQLAQAGEFKEIDATLQAAQGQIDIDKTEAGNTNVFVSGWRPAIGWVSAVSLFVYYVPYCLVATYIWAHQCWVSHALAARPDLGISDLIGLVASMLGLAGMRTFEKTKGIAAK